MGETDHQPLDSRTHQALLATLVERGRAPTLDELALRLGASAMEVERSLRRLDANHGVVLHPGSVEPWLVHPFSTTPTLFYVETDAQEGSEGRGWWAPCIWCALGVANLVQRAVTIKTRLGADGADCELAWRDGHVTPDSLVVHFPIRPVDAWRNVHRHCACTLVFADEAAVDDWCERHGIARGATVSMSTTQALAKAWYGRHLSPEWRKPTASEAQAVFESVGLTAPHWHLAGGDVPFGAER